MGGWLEPFANKLAFRPDAGETGISVFLADLVNPGDVILGLDGYGVCEFTVEALLEEVQRLRSTPENRFSDNVTITFDPDVKRHPRAGHAHCYIDPVPAIVQKALYKRVAKMTEGFLPGPAVAGRLRDET